MPAVENGFRILIPQVKELLNRISSFESNVHFFQLRPDNLNNLEKQIFSRLSRILDTAAGFP